jgi:hypothetical protein
MEERKTTYKGWGYLAAAFIIYVAWLAVIIIFGH